jgi:hypothetical protein
MKERSVPEPQTGRYEVASGRQNADVRRRAVGRLWGLADRSCA